MTVALFLWTLLAPQPAALPRLYVEVLGPQGKPLVATGGAIRASSHARIRMNICIRVRSVSDAIEQPEIDATNQHPDYFKHRPPPNITLAVAKVDGPARQEMPFRVVSSGGGKSLTLHYRDAEIDLLESKAVREQRARQFAEWMAAQTGGRSHLTSQPGLAALTAQLDEMYIHNPPGEYEITARYAPSTAENWKGVLISPPLRIRVADEGDLFDQMKAKMGARP